MKRIWREFYLYGGWLAFQESSPGPWAMQLVRICIWLDMLSVLIRGIPNLSEFH